MENRARRHDLSGRIDVLGTVDDPQDVYSCFDVLVLPSLLEGRPNVVLECMAMGIPVIASDVGGLPELVAHLQTGYLCVPGDAKAFAQAVRVLASDPVQLEAMQMASREAAEALHPAHRMLDSFHSMFDEVLGVAARQTSDVRAGGAVSGDSATIHDVSQSEGRPSRVRNSPRNA